VKPHAMTAMTRLMITPPTWRHRAAIPRKRHSAGPHAKGPGVEASPRVGLKCGAGKEK
jgi:hypothetical protein